MQFHRSVSLVVLVFTFRYHFSDVLGNIPSTILEESVKLKLRTAASLRDNVVKIFNQLQSNNYELHQSIEQIQKYLKNGGSLIDCLHVLPTLGYVSVERQINGILINMEECFPRYLLPAISVLQNACNHPSNVLNFEEILQPDGGPLRIDIFKDIKAHDLPKLALPTRFPENVEWHELDGRWPSFVEKVIVSISMGFLNYTRPLMGLILQNLISFNHSPQLMKSVEQFRQNFGNYDEEIEYWKLDSDLYVLVENVLSNTDRKSPSTATTDSILSYLYENLETRGKHPKLATFFNAERMNYSLLLSENKQLMKSKSAKTLLTLIQKDNSLLENALDDFLPHEYSTPDDLVMAVVSKVRRYQAHEGTISEVVENVYEDLIQNFRHATWKKLPWSGGTVKTLLYGMKADSNSPKIRRLAEDVSAGIEVDVKLEAWPKILSYIPNVNCYGPSCLVLQTLESIQKLNATKEPALNASIMDLVKTYKQYYNVDIFNSCRNLLIDNSFEDFESTKTFDRTVNAEDLMQAIPGLDITSKEYIILRDFVYSKDLEKYIGEKIDVEAHPTRGRLLAWLLGKIERSTEVKDEVRNAAEKFVDVVSYDGYGAAGVLLHPM